MLDFNWSSAIGKRRPDDVNRYFQHLDLDLGYPADLFHDMIPRNPLYNHSTTGYFHVNEL
jgi:hypothetical protein